MRQVEALKQKDPHGFVQKNATKRLAAIAKLVFEKIPRDPTAAEFRQGDTLGPRYKHWFRAKVLHAVCLFFRFHVESKVIALGWVNDEDWVIWFGCTSKRSASSASVASPLRAAKATFALKAGEW